MKRRLTFAAALFFAAFAFSGCTAPPAPAGDLPVYRPTQPIEYPRL